MSKKEQKAKDHARKSVSGSEPGKIIPDKPAESGERVGRPLPSTRAAGKSPVRRPTVALTLGSGGARGYAHIGAIEVLVERGYDIIAISGCSMGALIGGVFAAGKMQDYKDWVTGLGQFDVLKLLDVSLSSPGAIRGDKIFSVVREMLGDTRIEDLPLFYTAVATDLLSHKEIWFQEGPLHQAIRASVAIPGVITPVILNGRVLVDGALLNPLPIVPTISSHADLVFAINLSGEDDRRSRLSEKVEVKNDDNEIDEDIEKIQRKASRWLDWDMLTSFVNRRDADSLSESDGDAEEKIARMARKKQAEKATRVEQEPTESESDEPETIAWESVGIGKFDVMNLAIETMQSALVQYKIAGYPPDLLVNVPKTASRTYDYHKAPELIQLGRERMTAALNRFENHESSSGPMAN